MKWVLENQSRIEYTSVSVIFQKNLKLDENEGFLNQYGSLQSSSVLI